MKRVLINICIWFSLAFPWPVYGTLYYYSGTMDANFEMTHEITITVPTNVSSLEYIYTLPENYTLPTNSQVVEDPDGVVFTYPESPVPTEEDYTDDTYEENHYKILTWSNPSAGTIKINVKYTVGTHANWSSFITSDLFPFDSSGLPAYITTYLEPTDEVQSEDTDLTTLASTLTSGITNQWEAVLAINGWVMDNISYGLNENGSDALSTYEAKVGVCSNFSHLAAALLRAAGIPARLASGYSLYKPYTLSTVGGTISTYWNQGPHAWIEVYYPSLGWVPYDPQRDIHHIDTYRVLDGKGPDLSEISGSTSATYSGTPSGSFSSVTSVSIDWISDDNDLSYIKSTNEINDFSLSTNVTFIELEDFTITATAESGGSISPAGEVIVTEGNSQAFTVSPDTWYEISDVLVDDVSEGAVSSYTFESVASDHSITAQFAALDDDEDNLPDWWEQQIIGYDQGDEITDINDVLPDDDFDGDGISNIKEYQRGTDPDDPASYPSKTMPWLMILLED